MPLVEELQDYLYFRREVGSDKMVLERDKKLWTLKVQDR